MRKFLLMKRPNQKISFLARAILCVKLRSVHSWSKKISLVISSKSINKFRKDPVLLM